MRSLDPVSAMNATQRVLCVHQGFPAQFETLVRALLQRGTAVDALHAHGCDLQHPQLRLHRWRSQRGLTPGLVEGLAEVEAKFLRAAAAAEVAERLEAAGYIPDLILAHPGWGESLFLRSIWPQVPQLHYLEYHYRPMAAGSDLDPDLEGIQLSERCALHRRVQAKNVVNLMALDDMDWGLAPTKFQAACFPPAYQPRISIIHDGIDCELLRPDPAAHLKLPSGLTLTRHQPVITFVNRSLEPYRGFPDFLRALPTVLEACPQAQVLVVGNSQGVSYGRAPSDGRTWKQVLLEELDGQLDLERVHFLGVQPRPSFIRLLQLSRCHVYLTVPFVLSWSLLEAMACGAPIVASDNACVREVLQAGTHGLLVDHRNRDALAAAILATLSEPAKAKHRGQLARRRVQSEFDQQECTQRRLALLDLVATGVLRGVAS
jgi:glycosyltransferase involved in cell wall biosynthesis